MTSPPRGFRTNSRLIICIAPATQFGSLIKALLIGQKARYTLVAYICVHATVVPCFRNTKIFGCLRARNRGADKRPGLESLWNHYLLWKGIATPGRPMCGSSKYLLSTALLRIRAESKHQLWRLQMYPLKISSKSPFRCFFLRLLTWKLTVHTST